MMWFIGSPLIICTYRVAADMDTGDMFTSAKLINVSKKTIRSVTFDVICYDSLRKPIGRLVNVTFRDIGAERNTDFGYERRIMITNPDTRNVQFILRAVGFSDGEVWNNTDDRRFNTRIEQEGIFTVQGDLNKQFLDICARSGIEGKDLVLQPVFTENYWLCSCGAFNYNDEEKCSHCRVSRRWLEKNTDIDVLKVHRDYQEGENRRVREQVEQNERAAAERKEASRIEFEQRSELLNQEKKRERSKKIKKRVILIILLLIIAAVILYCLLAFVFPKLLKDNEYASKDSSGTAGVSVLPSEHVLPDILNLNP